VTGTASGWVDVAAVRARHPLADAVTAAHLLFWLPPGVFSHQPYYILRPSIPEVPQPEQHGIFAVRARQFIDERFDCKDVRLGAKGP
jgi:hypothetical protein